ncbi:MAG TPA: hypothetical protein VJ874_03860, partial [Candidatus Thermoplasmatota archaeon]|nr:hypothetical protein [Candidatus Thermoplasmatota archaeon]
HAKALESIATWDEWDPDMDRWYYEWDEYVGSQPLMRGHAGPHDDGPNRDSGENGDEVQKSPGSPRSLLGRSQGRA